MSQTTPHTDLREQLDQLFGTRGMQQEQLKDEIMSLVEKEIARRETAALKPTNELCFECGNKIFFYDNAYRCIYDGNWNVNKLQSKSDKGGEL